jgi:threonine-phosphate decarboxylase
VHEVVINHGGDIFALARERGWAWQDMLDFSASINPLGPPPGVGAAICSGLDRIVHYPEREPSRLRRVLADTWRVAEDQLLLGNGATELIFFLARVFRGAPTALAAPVFSEFHRAFPEAYIAQLDEPASWPRGRLVVVTRPASPIGRTLELGLLDNFLKSGGHPVLVDESFIDFSEQPSAVTLMRKHQQVCILRSLTKFYALPGVRIGALIAAAETIRDWRKQREPWQVNVLAEEAALAALGDREHAARSIELVRRERSWLLHQFRALPGAEPMESDANFLYIRLSYPARQICDYLLAHKIVVRNCSGWRGLPHEAVRVAVRIRPENERLLDVWRTFRCD